MNVAPAKQPASKEGFWSDRNFALEAVRVTEAAALASFAWMGKGKEKDADRAAVNAMREALNGLSIDGTIVIGEGERDKAPMLYIGEKVGNAPGNGPQIDIALDPLEGTTLCAHGGANSLTVIAMAEKGGFLHAPDVYMRKIAVGGGLPAGVIDLDNSPEQNLKNLAKAKKCDVSDLVVQILERERHADMIAKVREAGARIVLIPDGDVAGVIATAKPDTGIDMYMGIGGAPEGVLAAAALRSIGGQMQGRLIFAEDAERERAKRMGITDFNRKYNLEDMAKGDVMFAATGVTDGSMLKGVRRFPGGATTHSIVMRSKTGTVRIMEAQHNFNRKTWLGSASNMLTVTSPCNGELLETLETDTVATLEHKISHADAAQILWQAKPRSVRAALLESLSAAITRERPTLLDLVIRDAGKTAKEAGAEVDGSADILLKTIKDSTLPDFNGMSRVKERPPVGVVGLITSFNFPLAVANWSIAPALLAGNAVVWKPSEKTPLVAIAYKKIFDSVAGEFSDLLQVVIGGREIGEALVASPHIDMVSATGSVAMGQGIKETLKNKTPHGAPPILELGGNNGVIISDQSSPAHLEFAVNSIMNSFLATAGQRCTNTRRLIVQKNVLENVVALFTQKIKSFVESGAIISPLGGISNDYGYGPLIDEDAFLRFEGAKAQSQKEGAVVHFGEHIKSQGGYYVAPALAVLPSQTAIMHRETFAPLLFIAPYNTFDEALALLNAPENAGLVGGIYTQSKKEAEQFAQVCEAGHCLINSPKGTGTPAFGMGFGGNKHSGEGEILNAADPLQAFTRAGHFRRIASNVAIEMND